MRAVQLHYVEAGGNRSARGRAKGLHNVLDLVNCERLRFGPPRVKWDGGRSDHWLWATALESRPRLAASMGQLDSHRGPLLVDKVHDPAPRGYMLVSVDARIVFAHSASALHRARFGDNQS